MVIHEPTANPRRALLVVLGDIGERWSAIGDRRGCAHVMSLNRIAGRASVSFPAGPAANAGTEDVEADIDKAFVRRIVVAQALDGCGAVVCVFSTWWSIGFIFAVHIN
jgi:hypothetical protein